MSAPYIAVDFTRLVAAAVVGVDAAGRLRLPLSNLAVQLVYIRILPHAGSELCPQMYEVDLWVTESGWTIW